MSPFFTRLMPTIVWRSVDFPGAVRPHEGNDASLRHLERHVPDGLNIVGVIEEPGFMKLYVKKMK